MCLYCFFLLGVNFDIDTGFKYRDIYIYILCSIRGVPWSSASSNSFTKDAAKVSVKGGFLDIGL